MMHGREKDRIEAGWRKPTAFLTVSKQGKMMKPLLMIGMALALLSGCGTNSELSVPVAPDAVEETTPPASTPTVSDTESHTISVELMTYQGGTEGAREYVVVQAKQACDSIHKAVYIEDLISETTWRGGMAQVKFICVDESDPRLKAQ